MWLLKTEPTTYSYDDLERDGRAVWDGVANPVALKNLRAAKAGDLAVIYHTGAEKSAVGLARVVRAAYADPKADDAKLVAIDLEPLRRLAAPIALSAFKSSPLFRASPLVTQGRLSVVALTAEQLGAIETGQLP
jgi:predicted RNA-binding protein with PUA-like domain